MNMKDKMKSFKGKFRASPGLHNVFLFLIFIAISALFWFLMALNDSVQKSFQVGLDIENMPDTAVFLQAPPEKFNVTLRDKGTSLFRASWMRTPMVHLNFNDYSDEGVFRISRSEIIQSIKQTFGKNAQILTLSLDSLNLAYTVNPGKKVPVLVDLEATATPGKVISGKGRSVPARATVYGPQSILDTVFRVRTERTVCRNVSEKKQITARLVPIPGTRIIPDNVRIVVNVEAMVNKEFSLPLTVRNLPGDVSLLLFPTKVNVSCFLPMSRLEERENDFIIGVDYNDAVRSKSGLIPVKVIKYPSDATGITLKTDSVEFSVVK